MNCLYIGSRRYSSWSMRGWLAVRLAGLDVQTVPIRLTSGNTPEVKRISPSGTVPVLRHDGDLVWDSLAIVEYCAEIEPALWPQDRGSRATARAMCAEMHSSFRDLRADMPMNLGARHPGQGRTPGALANIARIERIWAGALEKSGGPFLFGGRFGAADAMFAPVAARFAIYEPELTPRSQTYATAALAYPLVAEWVEAAAHEPVDWREPRYEEFSPSL